MAALGLLLLNDFYFKAHYGNWLTGKLSDFAGLVVVSLAALPFFAGRAKAVLGVIGLAFVFWKSPQSQPLIDFVNAHSAIRFGRVVDYSDLLALLVLPISARWFREYRVHPPAETLAHKVARWPMFAVTVLAITATPGPVPYWQALDARSTAPSATAGSAADIAFAALERQGFDCDVFRFCTRDDLRAAVCSEGERAWVVVEGPLNRGVLIARTGDRKRAEVGAVTEELRATLAPQLEVLAYIPSFPEGAPDDRLERCRRRER